MQIKPIKMINLNNLITLYAMRKEPSHGLLLVSSAWPAFLIISKRTPRIPDDGRDDPGDAANVDPDRARLSADGRTLRFVDGRITATALVHGLILVTRNVADFEPMGVRILNPWE